MRGVIPHFFRIHHTCDGDLSIRRRSTTGERDSVGPERSRVRVATNKLLLVCVNACMGEFGLGFSRDGENKKAGREGTSVEKGGIMPVVPRERNKKDG